MSGMIFISDDVANIIICDENLDCPSWAIKKYKDSLTLRTGAILTWNDLHKNIVILSQEEGDLEHYKKEFWLDEADEIKDEDLVEFVY